MTRIRNVMILIAAVAQTLCAASALAQSRVSIGVT